MQIELVQLVFYVLSAVMLASALGVISVKNPIHAVLLLILCFFNAAGLFVLLGAEFLAMLLIIVYVGAVAILFLFVVMMLNIHISRLREGFLRYIPLGIAGAAFLFAELYFVLEASTRIQAVVPGDIHQGAATNTHAIGKVLYTQYVVAFQISGLLLLVAMIGAIALTLRHREGVRRQNMVQQFARDSKTAVVLTQPAVGAGVDVPASDMTSKTRGR